MECKGNTIASLSINKDVYWGGVRGMGCTVWVSVDWTVRQFNLRGLLVAKNAVAN